jgi:formylglycine-generating enzyme required for sulfatase activity
MKLVIATVFMLIIVTGCAGTPQADYTAPYIETGINSDEWVSIPGGDFYLGQHDIQTDIDYDFSIMVTDVTNAQYASFLNNAAKTGFVKLLDSSVVGYYPGDEFRGHKHEVEITAGDWVFTPLNEPGMRLRFEDASFRVLDGFENHPMTFVTWFGAWGYCQYNNWRLPTGNEWEKAGRGVDNRPYPWGYEMDARYANFVSSHDIFERMFDGAGGTTPVGFYNGKSYLGFNTYDGASPYGLYDMAGNVWQWVGDIQEGAHYRKLRGGSHTNYAYNLRIWTHNNADPTHFSPSVGFRCAKDM